MHKTYKVTELIWLLHGVHVCVVKSYNMRSRESTSSPYFLSLHRGDTGNPPWLCDLACIWLTTLVTAIRPDLPNFYCSGLVHGTFMWSVKHMGGPVRINGWQADPVAKCQGSLWFQCDVQIKNCELFRRVKSRLGLHTRVEPKYLGGTAPRINCSLSKQVDLALLEPLYTVITLCMYTM